MNTLRLSFALALLAGSSLSVLADSSITAAVPGIRPSEPVIILFDRSASMKKKMEGVSRIDIARESLVRWGNQLKGRSNVGIRFFAGGTDQGDDQKNCVANDSVVNLGEVIDSESIVRLADGIQAVGRKTNIAYALEMAREELHGQGPGKIILITDGQENCKGDPLKQAGKLGEMGIKVDVVGIGDAGDIGGLGKIALETGGRFDLASNSADLQQKLSDSLPDFDLPDLPLPPGQAPGGGGSMEQIIEVAGGGGNRPSVPAPASTPLVLETMEVSESGPQRIAIEIILDLSGSMAAKLGDESKIRIARRALAETLDGLEDSFFLVGLRAYGFDNTVEKSKATSCPNTALLTAISTNNLRNIRNQASRLNPYGYTPIADSLMQAGDDLQAIDADSRMIILITDGEETCDGDPVATARHLCQMGIELETNIIGFDLEPSTAEVMRKAAKAGCGRYVDAQDAGELTAGLEVMVSEARDKIDPTWMRTIHPVQGGSSIATALPVTPGTYTLKNWLEKGEQMFFRVDTVAAQHVLFRGLIQSYRLINQDKEMVESSLGRAQYRLTLYLPGYDPAEPRADKKTRFMRISGDPGTFRSIGQQDFDGRGIVFSIGSKYDRVHADSLFNVEIRESGDIFEGYEAAETITRETLTLEAGKPSIGHLGEGDFVDLFALPGMEDGATINLTISNPEFAAGVELLNQKGRRIQRKRTVGGRVSFDLKPGSGVKHLSVYDRNPKLRQVFTDYAITIDLH
ncbi:MAG: VWA domain-containing protein [Arenicellales bacterium]|jgi:hypothetical protein|nr:VWA domain-containing protein [Arenicellales bacterium]|tara:strand:+ start:413 stop:2647 length:2235 start_codon:yes stop_codon:yes gene_type:complete